MPWQEVLFGISSNCGLWCGGTMCMVSVHVRYLDLVVQRATGELLTPATWMRRFVQTHPSYKKDSVVSQDIAYDLLQRIDQISRGAVKEPALYGDFTFEPITKEDAFPASLGHKTNKQS